MESKGNIAARWEQFEEEVGGDEDALSLSNFAMQEDQTNGEISGPQTPRDHQSSSSSSQYFFEFSNEFSSPEYYYRGPDLIFRGKLEEELNEYQKRDYFTVIKSHRSLLTSPPSYYEMAELSRKHKSRSNTTTPKPSSVRLSNSNSNLNSNSNPSPLYHRDQKVNITALTSMSTKSRRRMFMIGPMKLKPEMELSAIKERQARRLRTTITAKPTPAAVVGGEAVVAKPGGTGTRRSHWGIVRSLRGRGPLTNLLTKSFGFGCSSGNWIKVAN